MPDDLGTDNDHANYFITEEWESEPRWWNPHRRVLVARLYCGTHRVKVHGSIDAVWDEGRYRAHRFGAKCYPIYHSCRDEDRNVRANPCGACLFEEQYQDW